MTPIAKRAFDLAFTIPASIILLPLMGLIALLVRLKLGVPILFRRRCPALYDLSFSLYQSRTSLNGWNRVTCSGHWTMDNKKDKIDWGKHIHENQICRVRKGG